MPKEPSTGLLEAIIEGRGRGAKIRRTLIANRESNWLLALTLNAFTKAAINSQMTDLETLIVQGYRERGLSNDYLAAHGRLFQQLPDQQKNDFFPGRFARLSPDTGYTLAALEQELPVLEKAILAEPNAADVDIHAIHEGRARVRDYRISREVANLHAMKILRAVTPNEKPPNPKFTIKATGFRCIEESSEWSDSDEVYWIFATTAPNYVYTNVTHVFNDVDAGLAYAFPADEGSIWGPGGAPAEIPDGQVGVLVDCWEKDQGDMSAVIAGVGGAFAGVAGILAATGAAAWVAAVIAAVGAVIAWLLTFLNDDHIASWAPVFSRATVEGLVKGQSRDVINYFSDQDANYKLRIRMTRTE
jgi:hypothetical protein